VKAELNKVKEKISAEKEVNERYAQKKKEIAEQMMTEKKEAE